MTVVNESIIKFRSRNATLLSTVLLHPKWQANILYYLLHFILRVSISSLQRDWCRSHLYLADFYTVTKAMRLLLFFTDYSQLAAAAEILSITFCPFAQPQQERI